MNIVRIICLHINMYTEVKGADTGSSRAGICLFCHNSGKGKCIPSLFTDGARTDKIESR